MKKSLLVLFLIVFIVPSVALASWYNPFSWEIWNNIFHKKEVTPQTQVINQPINTELVDNSTVTTSMTKEVKNDTPVVDNSNAQKKEAQAKIDAELKAKAELDILISKQKLEEQTKLEAELKAKQEQDALIAKQKAEEQAKKEETQRVEQEKITPTPTPTPIVPTGPVSTTDGVDPQININMNANLDDIAKSLVTNTSCPNKPIIIFSPQNYVDNKTHQITVVSVVGDTITFSSNQSIMLMGVSLYDPCMPSEQLTWSYTSPMTGTIGTNTNLQSPTGGMAEASIDSSSQGPQTITVTASELGGETVTKSITVKMSGTPLVVPKQTRPAVTGSASA